MPNSTIRISLYRFNMPWLKNQVSRSNSSKMQYIYSKYPIFTICYKNTNITFYCKENHLRINKQLCRIQKKNMIVDMGSLLTCVCCKVYIEQKKSSKCIPCNIVCTGRLTSCVIVVVCRRSTRTVRSSPRLCLRWPPLTWWTWASASSPTPSRTSGTMR